MAILMGVGNGNQNRRNGEPGSRRSGAVNGLTNGSGMTNGSNQRRPNSRNKGNNGTNMKAGLAILVFIILLIPPIMILLGPSEQRKIDGNLDDWADKAYVEQTPAGMDVPITRYAVDFDEKYVYFYVQVQSPRAVFESSGNARDTVVMFVDTMQAGYRFDGCQAKYKVEISGSDGNVVSASLSEYRGDGSSWKWEAKGSIEAKANLNTLEGRIKKSDIGNADPSIYIVAQRADGKVGRSIIPLVKAMKGLAVSQVGIADEIIQPDANATLLTI
ncbi:MAG: hypothetical protein N3F63_04785, partial [Thermoplasmata archaeon]|nr:hypothetical protein [Thermoplasmata archaeon]